MINSKIYQIILLFNDKSRHRLQTFIASSYFNTETKVAELFAILNQPLLKNTTKEQVFEKIYPLDKFNNTKFNYLVSQLLSLIRKFTEVEDQLNNPSFYKVAFLQELRAQNMEHLYLLEENKIQVKAAKIPIAKSIDYHDSYLFNFERMHFHAERNRTEPKYLQSMHLDLDAYYFIEKLKIACVSINQQNLYKMDVAKGFFEPLIEYLEKYKLHEEIPLLSIYYNAYKMLTEEKELYFKLLKNNLSSHNFDSTEIKDAFIFALNFTIKTINEGKVAYNDELFDLYQLGIEKEILLEQGKLSAITYSNVVTVGLRLKRYDEVGRFIEDNRALLSGKNRKPYYIFNRAKLYFELGEYGEVTNLYNEGTISEVLLNTQMRILQLKAFYELGEKELCASLIQSLDKQLNRKGILAYHKEIFKNTVKVFKRLLKINRFDKTAIKKLQELINTTNPLTEKLWLLEKIESLS